MLIGTISAVSAVDLNVTDAGDIENTNEDFAVENVQNEINVDNDVKIGVNENSNVLNNSYTPKTFSEIQTTVDSATDGDTIILDGYYLFTSTVNVRKQLTFVGRNDATVDGDNSVRLFDVRESGVTFKNILFKNGKTDVGGAIYVTRGGSIVNCSFVNNSATSGGAIKGEASIVNCSFVGNSANSNYGGAIDFYTENSSVVNSVFVNNSAKYGGAVNGYGSVVNCSFVGNSATVSGGAINFFNYGLSGSVVNCVFVNNSAKYGGAIRSGSVENSSFKSNSAEYGGAICEVHAVDCSFIGNSASQYGGAMDYGTAVDCSFINNTANINGGAMDYGTAVNCSFINNTARGSRGMGGAIFGNVDPVNCSFVGNSAVTGGAIYFTSGGSVVNCSFVGNSAVTGGAIDFVENGRSVVNSVFVNNSATNAGAIGGNANVMDCSFVGNSAVDEGGAVSGGSCVNCSFVGNSARAGGAVSGGSVENCIFINNSANWYGAALYKGSAVNCSFVGNSASKGGALYDSDAINCSFVNNSDKGGMYDEGGAVYSGSAVNCIFVGNSATSGGAIAHCNAVNCTFRYNYAPDGGAGYMGTVEHCLFEYNKAVRGGAIRGTTATYSTFNHNTAIVYGGAAYSAQVSTNSKFYNNTAGTDGDNTYRGSFIRVGNPFSDLNNTINANNNKDIYLNYDYIFSDSDSEFKEGIVINRAVTIHGNGYSISGENIARIFDICNKDVVLQNIVFLNGNASSGGGAINGTCTVVNCSFEGNSATNGGAISGTCTVVNCSFEGNSATNGGAISGTCTVVNCSFVGNSAVEGGGAVFGGSVMDCSFVGNSASKGGALNNVSCVNCNFDSNTASSGGAIYSYYGGSALNSSFVGNSAVTGGAIFSKDNPIVNCSFVGNYAKDDGGAVSGGSIADCSFVNNSAFSKGGAIKSGSAVNCSFVGNSAWYGGASSEVSCENCIFINNYVISRNSQTNYGADGGAMQYGSAVNCTFIGNSASGSSGKGGAIYTIYGNSIVNCSFINNSASGEGVAVYGSVPIVNSTFEGHGSNVLSRSSSVLDCIFDVYPTVSYHYTSRLNVNDLTVNFGDDGFLVVNLSDVRGGLSNRIIKLNIGENEYDVNSLDGSVRLNVNDYISDVGKYTLSFTYNGDSINNPVSRKVNVIIRSYTFLNGNDLSIVFGNDGFLVANLSDVRGQLSNKALNFTINGKKYGINTDSEGLVKLNIKNYITSPGIYVVGVNFEGDDVFYASSKNIRVDMRYNSSLNVGDLSIVQGDDGKLLVELSNVNGPLSGKTIVFTFNGKTITSPTSATGSTSLNIKSYLTDLGKYTVGVSFEGDSINYPISKNVNVYINSYKGDLSVSQIGKYYNDTILRFNLVNSKTKAAIPNASIKLTFSNGKPAVTIKTDSNGIADYSVPFAPGTYSLTASVIDSNVDVNTVTLNNFKINELTGIIDISQSGTDYNNSNLVLKLYGPNMGDVYRNVKINLMFITNGEIAEVTTDDDGIAIYHIPFDVGTYHVLAYVSGDYTNFDNVEKEDIIIDKAFSDVIFSNPISFGWGSSGSTTMTLVGVSSCQISVVGYEAEISRNGDKITVSGLDVGTYTLKVVTTPDSNHKTVTKTIGITVNKVASSVSGSNVVFDYGGSGSTTLTLNGASGVTAKVVDYSGAKVDVKGNVVTVSGLNAGNYTLQVTTVPDNRHTSVTKNIGVTVNKVVSSVSGSNVVFNYGGSGSTTLTLNGASGVTARVVGYSGAKVDVKGNVVTVSGLNAGSYTLQVVTIPDSNHNSVTKNIGVTVNKVVSSVSGSDIVFDYGGSGSTTLTLNGASGVTAKVVDHSEKAKISINSNKVTVSGLDAGTYTLQVVTIPDSNHNEVTKNIGITVKKVDSSISFKNTISFNVGSLGSTTVDIVGGSIDLSCISVVGHDEAVIAHNGNVISVSGLGAGTYTLNVVVKPDGNHNSVNGTVGITVTGSESGSETGKTESKISFSSKIEYDWGDSGSTTMALVGCSVSLDNISVVGHSEAIIGLEGNKIIVSNLTPGSYTLKVITTPYEKYYSVTNTIGITVRKVASSVSGSDIVFDYGGSGSTTLTLNGASGVTAKVVGYSGANVDVKGNVVTVSGLNAGSYTLQVVTSPDSNHNSVTKTISITVNKIKSSLIFDNDTISFGYGDSGSVGVKVIGGFIINDMISVIGHDKAETSFKNNKITVSGLNVGSYILQVVTSPDSNHYSDTKTIDVVVNKADSKVEFFNPIVFDYGNSGSTTLLLDGCTVSPSNINVIGYPDIPIGISNTNVVTISGLAVGNYTLSVTSIPDDNHNAVTNTTKITVNSVDSVIGFNKDLISFGYGGSDSVSVTVVGGNVVQDGVRVIGHSEANVAVKNNIITVSNLPVGSYVLEVTSNHDANHRAVTKKVNVSVRKVDSSISLNPIVFDYGGSGSTTLTLKGCTQVSDIKVIDYPNAPVSIKDNVITVSGLNVKTYTLSVTSVPDANHNAVTKTTTITVNKVDSSIICDNGIVFGYGGSGSTHVTVNGGNIVEGLASVVGHKEAVVRVSDNVVTVSNLPVGEYTLKVTSSPDGNHKAVSNTTTIRVNKVNSTVAFSNPVVFDYGGFGTTTLILDGCSVDLDNVSVVDHDEAVIGKNNKGVITLSNLTAGNYTLRVESTPDENHRSAVATLPVTVNKLDSDIVFIKDSISFKYSKSGSTPIVLDNCKVASMTVEGKSVKPVLKDNVITVSGLPVGKYRLKVTTQPVNGNYNSVVRSIPVVVSKNTAKITVKKQTFAYKKAGKWAITLKDSTGKAISKVKVTLKVYTGKNTKAYSSTATNSKGVAYFNKIKELTLGNHKVVVSFSHKGYTCKAVSSSIKVIKQTPVKFKIVPNTTPKGFSVSVIVKDKTGKKFVNGVKVKLTVGSGKNMKSVTLVSANYAKGKGVCAYSTNMLPAGTHKVTVTSAVVNYAGSASSKVTLKASAKKVGPWWEIVSNGKLSSHGLK